MPNPPNTVRNPAAMAAVAFTARPTAARRPTSSPRTTSARYAGSMAKPQGFSAATSPAPKAKPTRSWSTVRGDLRQRRYPVGQLLLRHGRGRVVHERRRPICTVEHVRRLPRDVVAGPYRRVGIVEVGEVEVVLRHEALHGRDVGARRDADEGDLGIGRRDLADAWRFRVAERAPRRPEPQHRWFPNQACPVERRTGQRRSGELQPIVGNRRRRTDKAERQGRGHRAEYKRAGQTRKSDAHPPTPSLKPHRVDDLRLTLLDTMPPPSRFRSKRKQALLYDDVSSAAVPVPPRTDR